MRAARTKWHRVVRAARTLPLLLRLLGMALAFSAWFGRGGFAGDIAVALKYLHDERDAIFFAPISMALGSAVSLGSCLPAVLATR